MSGIARIGDMGIGTCPCHKSPVGYTTLFVTGAATVDVNGQPATFVGTLGVASCGHMTIMHSGSPNVEAEGKPVSRIGDVGANCGAYVTVTGSPDSVANGD